MRTDRILALAIDWNGAAVTGVRIDDGRATDIGRILHGRTTDEAIAAVPRLFSVCRRSQQVAARVACEFAVRGSADPSMVRFGELEVLSECALESSWRILLDWPPLFGEAARTAEFAAFRTRMLAATRAVEAGDADERMGGWRLVASGLERFLAESVFGVAPEAWKTGGCEPWLADARTQAARIVNGLLSAPEQDGRVAPLPWVDASALREEIAPAMEASDDFERRPLWRGGPAEVGALAREGGNADVVSLANSRPNAARLLARLVELAGIPQRMRELASGGPARWVRGAPVKAGVGLAAIETARGTLLHHVRIDGARVERWRIAAPTEWNFHPEGAFVHGLVGAKAKSAEEAERAAQLLACALDPCVAYGIEVADA